MPDLPYSSDPRITLQFSISDLPYSSVSLTYPTIEYPRLTLQFSIPDLPYSSDPRITLQFSIPD
jgi:hypothetical protein